MAHEYLQHLVTRRRCRRNERHMECREPVAFLTMR